MNPSLLDRIISFISYYTFGIFSIIWIIFANLTGRKISPFLSYNIYQAIFISVILAMISLIYDIAINFMSVIPIVGNIVKNIHLFLNATPLYFGFTITGFIVTIFISILAIVSLFGKRPKVPFVSDIIKSSFGG